MEKEKKQIVFFCATAPYVMIYKVAREFKKKGYETILITISQRDKWNNDFYKDAFDKIICSNFQVFKPTPKNIVNMTSRLPDLVKSIHEMGKLKPYVIFDISRPNYVAAIFMRFFKKYPIIYFPADISSHLHPTLESALKSGRKMYEIKAERYCFEHADGIFHKGAPQELQHLYKENMLGPPLKMTSNIICFNPYCSDEFIVPISKSKLSKKDGCLHIVYVGSLFNEPKDIEFYTNFFEKLIEQKIHVHLYVKTHHFSVEDDKKYLSPLIKRFEKSKYVHFDFAVPPKELVKELSKYDFGFTVDRFRHEGDIEHIFTIGNKFSSYLEAGIPFLYTSTHKFMDDLLKKYKLDFPIDTHHLDSLNGLGNRLKKRNYKAIEKNILKARKDFNMKKHLPRLERFIEKVVKEKQNRTSH